MPTIGTLETEVGGFYPVAMITMDHWVRKNVVLLGDAAHALHPGRSQGMNVTFKCVDHLIRYLPEPDQMGDVEKVTAALKRFEEETKPGIDEILKDNHARGLEMDSAKRTDSLALAPGFRALAADPDASFVYRMKAAGYTA